MKTKSPLLIAIGALALFVSLAFPSSTALANCAGDPDEPYVYYEYGGPTGILVEMEVAYPTGAMIFFTTNGSNPTHTGSTPGPNTAIYYGNIFVPYRSCINIRALAWKAGSSPCWNDSAIVYFQVCNPTQ